MEFDTSEKVMFSFPCLHDVTQIEVLESNSVLSVQPFGQYRDKAIQISVALM